jgi:dolichol-phosphate mannosyltransferase
MLELAIVVPTFKERGNIRPLLSLLDQALKGIEFEVIFVDDDSPDGTANLVRTVSLERRDVRVLQRVGRRGLASACVEGMMSTAAPYIAVMDADLQHDETILPEMLRRVRDEPGVDLAVASRNVEGGSMGEFTQSRVAVSDMGRKISSMVCRCEITDPMSGFFLVNRKFMEEVVPNVSAIGFKILVDLIASCKRPVVLREVPYRFRQREHGESKLDTLVLVEYLQLVADKMIGQWIPPRFVLFGAVGLVGAALYLALLALLFRAMDMDYRLSLVIATVAAMTSNFLLNNMITYRDRRLKGAALITGLLTFYVACSLGALVSVRLSEMWQSSGVHWLWAGVGGVLIASVWNYSMTQFFTWRINRKALQKARQVRTV